MRLLLTGATGFFGRNCLLKALSRYEEVFTPVRSAEKLHAQLAAEGKDIPRLAVRILPSDPAKWPPFSVEHAILGAGVLFARSRQEYFSTNVDWTLRVMRSLPEDCRTVILSSQSAGGSTPPNHPVRSEENTDAPVTWYGESKLALERALRTEFPHRPITILRPPMILGPRDAATLPLFRMAKTLLRLKPGLRTKNYSFIAVDDLVEAVSCALNAGPLPGSLYVASPQPITDWELIASAAQASRSRGLTVPVPQAVVRLLSFVVDAIPALRAQTPSLTRDRAQEIWPDRWVVDSARFSQLTGWQAQRGLEETLQAAHDYYAHEGAL